MRLALQEAEQAWRNGEIPIGAVVVKDGGIVGVRHTAEKRGMIPQPMPKSLRFAVPPRH